MNATVALGSLNEHSEGIDLPQIDVTINSGKFGNAGNSGNAGEWPPENVLIDLVGRAVIAVAIEAGLSWPSDAELSLLFTDNAEMAEINGQWRNKPKATNVLSFPGGDVAVGEPSGQIIGDLVFAFETVLEEAETQGKSFENHLVHLVIHGFLHLFGHDHLEEGEAELMETLEKLALRRLNIDDPYKDL